MSAPPLPLRPVLGVDDPRDTPMARVLAGITEVLHRHGPLSAGEVGDLLEAYGYGQLLEQMAGDEPTALSNQAEDAGDQHVPRESP